MLIRQIHSRDVDAVRELDAQAFTPYFQRTGRGESCPVRSQESVLSCLARNPSGCFVAEDDSLVGYVFSRKWGTVGWIGTFGIHPSRQGQGIGRQLLDTTIKHLEDSKCTMIGLETMPDSPYNVGLYASAGFQPEFSTVLLCKEIDGEIQSPPFISLDEVETDEGLAALSEISSSAIPGLDYAIEAQNASDFGWGDTIFLGWPDPWACAIVKSQGTAVFAMAVVVRPEARTRIDSVIEAITAWAYTRGLTKILLPVNTADWSTLQWLIDNKFRVINVALRMMLRGSYGCPSGIDMSRWAM